MFERCPVCGTKLEVERVEDWGFEQDCQDEHCHDRDCSNCEINQDYYVCPICEGRFTHESLVEMRQCTRCSNYTPKGHLCFWCRDDVEILPLVKSLYPYQGNALLTSYRKAYVRMAKGGLFNAVE